MIPYFLIFFLLLLPIKKRYINSWCFLLLLLFTIVRWDVGWDYRIYYSLAENKTLNEIPLFFEKQNIYKYLNLYGSWLYLRNEFFIRFISKIIWTFNLSAQTIIIFYSTIILYFIKKGLDNLRISNKFVWIWFYSFPYFYFTSLSIMRQWAAISIVFYAYRYIIENNIKKYIIWILLAGLFHKTALLMIILYFLEKIYLSKVFYVFSFILSFFFLKIFTYIVLNINIPVVLYYKLYVVEKIGEGGAKMYYFIMIIYIFLLFNIIFSKINELKGIYNFLFIGCFIYTSLIQLGHLGIRISMYFFVFSLILIDKYTISQNNRKEKLKVFILSFLLLLSLLIIDTKKEIRSEYIPYQTIFNKKFIKERS